MSEAQTPIKEHIQIIQEKHKKLPKIIKESGIDCWLIFARETASTPDSSMRFVVGSEVVGASAFIFSMHPNENTLKKIALVANFDSSTEKNKGIWDEVIGYKEEGLKPHLQEKLEQLQPRKIGLNYSTDDFSCDGLSHGMWLFLHELIPSHIEKFVSAQKIVNAIRGSKSKIEIALIKKACEITEEINQNITVKLEIGQSEIDIQRMFYREVEKRGLGYSWQRNQNPAIDVSPKEFGHTMPQNTKTYKGCTLHNDFGILYHGYGSDLQRMWYFGNKEDVPNELRKALDTIIQGIQLGADAIKPGIPGFEIDKIVRNHLVSQDYDEFVHGLGHQVGIMAHDGGAGLFPQWERYKDLPNMPLEVGQVFTIEPSLKTKNYGGVSLEEMVVVTEDGCEFLVPPAKDFIYIS